MGFLIIVRGCTPTGCETNFHPGKHMSEKSFVLTFPQQIWYLMKCGVPLQQLSLPGKHHTKMEGRNFGYLLNPLHYLFCFEALGHYPSGEIIFKHMSSQLTNSCWRKHAVVFQTIFLGAGALEGSKLREHSKPLRASKGKPNWNFQKGNQKQVSEIASNKKLNRKYLT